MKGFSFLYQKARVEAQVPLGLKCYVDRCRASCKRSSCVAWLYVHSDDSDCAPSGGRFRRSCRIVSKFSFYIDGTLYEKMESHYNTLLDVVEHRYVFKAKEEDMD